MFKLTAAGVNALQSVIQSGGGKINGNTAKPLVAEGLIKEQKDGLWTATAKAYKLLGLNKEAKAPKVKEEKAPLTPLQRKVMEALYAGSSGNGHDFGLLEVAAEEAIGNGVSIYQFGAVVSTLIEKKTIFEGTPALNKVEVLSDRKRVFKQYVLTKYARTLIEQEN